MAAMNTPRRGLLRCERGAQLVEFAFVFPTLLLVMLGVFDVGFMMQRYEVLTNAAREGARVAILAGYTNTDVTSRVNAYLTAGGLPGTAAVAIDAQTITVGGQCITVRPVTVTYDYEFQFVGPIINFFGGSSLGTKTLSATASMRSEFAAESCE
jgi:Flp pilus assembly protein TadG